MTKVGQRLLAAGTVLLSRERVSLLSGSDACDTALGAAPSATTDFDFGAVDFASDDVFPFPGMQ